MGKVTDWVIRAVQDIARFDGNNKINGVEKDVLAGLLANVDKPEDKEFIEGFMMEHEKKVPGLKKHSPVNEERSVETPVTQWGASSPEELEKVKELYNTQKHYFDAEGKPLKQEIKDVNGNITVLNNVERLENGDVKINSTQKMLEGGTIESVVVHHNPVNDPNVKPDYDVLSFKNINPDGECIYEVHLNDDGSMSGHGIAPDGGTIEYSGRDGKCVAVVKDKEGNITETLNGSYANGIMNLEFEKTD